MDQYTDKQLVEELFRRNNIAAEADTDESLTILRLSPTTSNKVWGRPFLRSDFSFGRDGSLVTIELWQDA